MKKNDIILLIIGLALAILSGIYIIYKMFFGDVWSKNADKLSRKISSIDKNVNYISDLKEYIPFEWDKLYVFDENVQIDRIYEIVGYKWENINKITNKGMDQLVFVKDSKVVCYVYGYPRKKTVSYEFENLDNNGEYTVFENDSKLAFDITIEKNGIKCLKFSEEKTKDEVNENIDINQNDNLENSTENKE